MKKPLKDYLIYAKLSFGSKKYHVRTSSIPKAIKLLYSKVGKVEIQKVLVNEKEVDNIYLHRIIDRSDYWLEKRNHTVN